MTLTTEQAEARKADPYPDKYIVKEATKHDDGGYTIATTDGTAFGLSAEKSAGAEIKAGDNITLYTHRGSMIRGIDHGDTPLFYHTQDDLDAEHKEYREKQERKHKQEFEDNRQDLDKRFDALPPAFQTRISRRRRNNPNFRWEYEAYELFACEEAVSIAIAFDTAEEIGEFAKLPYAEQEQKVPGLRYSEHSGNTFSVACRLAMLHLFDPDGERGLVDKQFGALAPLVGSEAYGDVDVEVENHA